MKLKWTCLFSLLVSVLFSQNAYPAELENTGTAMRKLQRGFLNMALSPWELAHELTYGKKTDSAVPTWVGGLGRGSIYTAGRALTGVYELVTFPIPIPRNYEPVIQPEFAWQHFEDSSETAS